jgi:hypothetical protein
MLVIEDLRDARWPPPWDRNLVDAVLEQIYRNAFIDRRSAEVQASGHRACGRVNVGRRKSSTFPGAGPRLERLALSSCAKAGGG